MVCPSPLVFRPDGGKFSEIRLDIPSRKGVSPSLCPSSGTSCGKEKTIKGEKYWSDAPLPTLGVSPKVVYTYPCAGLLKRDEKEEEEEERGEISSRAGQVEGEEEVGQAGGSHWHLGGKLRWGRQGERDGVSQGEGNRVWGGGSRHRKLASSIAVGFPV